MHGREWARRWQHEGSRSVRTPPVVARTAEAERPISLSFKTEYRGEEEDNTWLAATCPDPFEMVGCTCLSVNGDCFGTRFGQSKSSAGGHLSFCNVSFSSSYVYSRKGPALLYVQCLWIGPKAQLVTARDEADDMTCTEARSIGLGVWGRGASPPMDGALSMPPHTCILRRARARASSLGRPHHLVYYLA
jgi:hypothetical protein